MAPGTNVERDELRTQFRQTAAAPNPVERENPLSDIQSKGAKNNAGGKNQLNDSSLSVSFVNCVALILLSTELARIPCCHASSFLGGVACMSSCLDILMLVHF